MFQFRHIPNSQSEDIGITRHIRVTRCHNGLEKNTERHKYPHESERHTDTLV